MKYILAVLVGVFLGYAWGYSEARDGKPSLMKRGLEKFGVEKVRDASARRDEQLDQ